MGRHGDVITLDHSGWWLRSLHCSDTAVMKSCPTKETPSCVSSSTTYPRRRRRRRHHYHHRHRTARTQVLANVLNLKARSRAAPSLASAHLDGLDGSSSGSRAGRTAASSAPAEKRGCMAAAEAEEQKRREVRTGGGSVGTASWIRAGEGTMRRDIGVGLLG